MESEKNYSLQYTVNMYRLLVDDGSGPLKSKLICSKDRVTLITCAFGGPKKFAFASQHILHCHTTSRILSSRTRINLYFRQHPFNMFHSCFQATGDMPPSRGVSLFKYPRGYKKIVSSGPSI